MDKSKFPNEKSEGRTKNEMGKGSGSILFLDGHAIQIKFPHAVYAFDSFDCVNRFAVE